MRRCVSLTCRSRDGGGGGGAAAVVAVVAAVAAVAVAIETLTVARCLGASVTR